MNTSSNRWPEFASEPTEYVVGVAAKAGQTVTVEDLFPDQNSTPVALGFLADL